jgi:predicted DNA-binding transcriptional regulator AlpA
LLSIELAAIFNNKDTVMAETIAISYARRFRHLASQWRSDDIFLDASDDIRIRELRLAEKCWEYIASAIDNGLLPEVRAAILESLSISQERLQKDEFGYGFIRFGYHFDLVAGYDSLKFWTYDADIDEIGDEIELSLPVFAPGLITSIAPGAFQQIGSWQFEGEFHRTSVPILREIFDQYAILLELLADLVMRPTESSLPPAAEVISRTDLLTLLEIPTQTLHYRIKENGFPKPVRIEGKKQWFSVSDVNAWRRKNKDR